jgi:hypothetical protein
VELVAPQAGAPAGPISPMQNGKTTDINDLMCLEWEVEMCVCRPEAVVGKNLRIFCQFSKTV